MDLDFTPTPWKIFTDVQMTHCLYPIIKDSPLEFIYFYTVWNIKLKLFKVLLLFRAQWKDLLLSLKFLEVGGSSLVKVPHVDCFLQ